MKLIPLPAFQDNYLWLLHDRQRALVDPGGAQPVLAALQHHGLQLEAILVTHPHAAPTGGLDAVRETIPRPLLSALPADTRVCRMHEYTPGNLNFAPAVEPGSADLFHYGQQRRELRTQGVPTLPPAFDARTTQDEVGTFAALRQ